MKILLLQDYLRSGGTERQTVLLARGFTTAGHPADVLTFRPGGPLVATLGNTITHRVLQSFDTRLDWFAPGLTRAVAQQQPDVILCMGRMANCYGATLQNFVRHRWPNVSVVATMRTGKNLPWLFRRSLRQVRHIVANSRAARDTLVTQYGISSPKITVIHNSLVFPPESSLVRNDSLRSAHGAGPNTAVFLSVAMFRPEKNQRELIEIAEGLPAGLDWQLWLAGDGPERAACETLVRQRNLGARVKFLGWQRDPTALYTAADVAVHASWSESLSNFLIEAQAHGVPGVAYHAQGVEECFLPNDTGVVIPRDQPGAFRAELVRLVAASPSERLARAARARTHAREAFDPQRGIAAHLRLFESLVTAPP